ncbi:UDP-N-acetylmuramate dehydrogenase [Caldicellulosiruptoraceae bacterium PP1]
MNCSAFFEQNGIEFYKDFNMKNITTFKIGGKAKYLVYPDNIDKLVSIVEFADESNTKYVVLGNCSNILVSDYGFDGIVIITSKINKFFIENDYVYAECGVLLSQLSRKVCELGLTGLEFGMGIPGTIGGAVYMNAGAYGYEIKDILTHVEVLDNREIKKLSNEELNFSYRHSILQDNNLILLKAYFKLKFSEDPNLPLKLAGQMNFKRKEKQPLNLPNAGSIFKRPSGYYAGKLIEDANLKGFRIGDAMVSEKHAGFIVNCGSATSTDVLKLIKHIQKVVFENYGVILEPEIKLIGNFNN